MRCYLGFSVLSLAVISGCAYVGGSGGPVSRPPATTEARVEPLAPELPPPPAPFRSDLQAEELVDAVLAAHSESDLDVKVNSGVVTLNGKVDSEANRRALVREIELIPGVSRVVDQTKIQE